MQTSTAPWDYKSRKNNPDDGDLTSRRPTPAQVRDAYIRAQLYYHATARQNREAREQIRILTNITAAGREAYEELNPAN